METGLKMVVVIAAGLTASMPVMPADYVIDKEGQHASVNFRASHLGYSFITGRFNDFDGKFSYDPAHPSDSKISLTINVGSLDTNHAERDKHLRSDKFLDVAQYPTIIFEGTGYTAGPGGDRLKGNLTVHGITRAIVINVNHVGFGKDPWGGYRSGFEGEITLLASDFGMPDWVGDIEFELNIEGIRQ